MSLGTPEKIRTLQRKLYRKAKAEPAFRFYVLYDKICRDDILRHAYGLARGNAGAPGVDGVSFAQIEEQGMEAWLASLREELVSKTYRPDPVRRVMIPKPDGGGERALGIPTIRDRVGRWTQSRKCTGSSAGATPMWLTLIYPATSIRFRTTSSSNQWLVASRMVPCCGCSSCG
jgi:hypothetical protein